MIFRFLTGLLAGLALSACAWASSPLQWDPRIIRGELDNGLRYQLIPDHSDPGRIDMRLTVYAGSVDEADDQVGVAHLVEHLVFHSRGQHADDVRARLEAAGFRQGMHYNAVTHYQHTQYLLSPPGGTRQSAQALGILATLAFAADYDTADLDYERTIVMEEWRSKLGVAERMNGQRIAAQRVGSRYPAHRTIGTPQAIESATLAQLQDYQQRWYVPNNMVLSLVGDFDPLQIRTQIEQAFGLAKAATLPTRQLELPLDTRIKIFRVQDSQSGSNQVALFFRAHALESRQQDVAGLRERLINRMTLSVLNRQLRRQVYPEGITSLTAVRTQIGRHSEVFGLAAGLRGDSHAEGLSSLLRELERLRQHGFHPEDVAAVRADIRRLAEGMLASGNTPDFETWVRRLNDATLDERPLLDPHAIARHTLAALEQIDAQALLARLQRWSDSEDRVLQLSAPGLRPLALPDEAAVRALAASIAAETLDPPLPPATEEAPAAVSPPPAARIGTILQKRRFGPQQVEYWTLDNGDRLVWLRRPGAQGRIQFQAESGAGFDDAGFPAWQSQFASQLAAQAQPAFWTAAQQNAWQAGVNLEVEQQAHRLIVRANAPADQLGRLLTLYRVRQTLIELDVAGMDEARNALAEKLRRQSDSFSAHQDRLWQYLLAGPAEGFYPSTEALETLTPDLIQTLWQRQAHAPVTYYLMADVAPEQLEKLVRSELASIVRTQAPPMRPRLLPAGRREALLSGALEPRARIQAASASEHPWSPEDAVRITALRELALNQLKKRLRQEAAGIYRMNFKATLSPEENRILSELSFTSAPQRMEELWALAQDTLAGLHAGLSEADIAPLRERFRQQETERRSDPDVQFRRLILSDHAWGDPRYLTRQAELVDALELAPMRKLATRLFAADNQAVLKVVP